MDCQTHYEHAINGVRKVTLSGEQGFQFASPSVWGEMERRPISLTCRLDALVVVRAYNLVS